MSKLTVGKIIILIYNLLFSNKVPKYVFFVRMNI